MKKLIIIFLVMFSLLLTACELDFNPPQEEVKEPVFEPIVTLEGAVKYHTENVVDIPCESPWKLESSLEYLTEPDEFGYYGSKGTTLKDGEKKIVTYQHFIECIVVLEYDEQGREKSGTFAYRFIFDPNNGWIKMHVCNYEMEELIDICPVDENGEYVWINNPIRENPDYETYLALI